MMPGAPEHSLPAPPGTDLHPHTRDRDCFRPRGAVGKVDIRNGYRRDRALTISTVSRISNDGHDVGLNILRPGGSKPCNADAADDRDAK
jgi:hypothetical protein